MFSAASLAAFERTLQVHVSRDLPDLARKALADGARATVRRVETEQAGRAGGIVPKHTAIVDGARGASLDAVRPDGVIAIDWNYMQEAVTRTVAYLRQHGPELKGDWKRNIMVEIDGAMVSPDGPFPKAGRIAYIGPDVPYARRLELGSAVQVPDHFVEGCVPHLARKLKNIADVRFTYASFVGANVRMTRKELRDSRVPAIRLIEVQP